MPESVSVWKAPIRPSRTPSVAQWLSPIVLVAQRRRVVLGQVVGQRGQHRVDLTGWGQTADRLVTVEVGGNA
jgi:hypothetical protein